MSRNSDKNTDDSAKSDVRARQPLPVQLTSSKARHKTNDQAEHEPQKNLVLRPFALVHGLYLAPELGAGIAERPRCSRRRTSEIPFLLSKLISHSAACRGPGEYAVG
jgi:hypothetical protein